MMRGILGFAALCAAAAVASSPDARAQIVHSSAQMSPGGVTIDFELLPIGATANPLTIGNSTFSAVGLGVVDVSPYGAQGSTVSDHTLLPFASGSFPSGGYTPITITFAAPVREVGLGWFDPNWPGNRLRVYDAQNVLIAEGTPALGATGGCCAAFIGAVFATPVIQRVEVVTDSGDDWYSIDNVRVVAGTAAPERYCTAKASSSGCLAEIHAATPNVQPISGAADYSVSVIDVEAQRNGLVFYGFAGPAAAPFQGGTRCVATPVARTPAQFSGGASGSCGGVYALLVNDTGQAWDPGAGQSAWFQAWYRDAQLADGFGTALSDAIRLDYQ